MVVCLKLEIVSYYLKKIMSYVGKPELIAQQSTNARSFILKNYGLVKRNNKVRQLYDN